MSKHPDLCDKERYHNFKEIERFIHPDISDMYIVKYQCTVCGYKKKEFEPNWHIGRCPTCEE